MFSLSDDEVQEIFASGNDVGNRSRSQFATLNKGRGHNIKYRPYAFTEHGILMLASVLKSEIAALVSIRITNAFVAMRKALASLAPLLARIEATDRRQIADQIRNDANQARNEERFKLILDAMQDKKFPPQKVFYDGQIYDAFEQMKKFVRMAKTELIIIDRTCNSGDDHQSTLSIVLQNATRASAEPPKPHSPRHRDHMCRHRKASRLPRATVSRQWDGCQSS